VRSRAAPAFRAADNDFTVLLLRATVMHTPRDPFRDEGALEAWEDGGVLVEGGRIAARGDFAALRSVHPLAEVRDLRPGLLLPGFVDAHVHYPQSRVVGAMGLRLLEWLRERTLPEEARLADVQVARVAARAFLANLLQAGTTGALVFGAHFPRAQGVFFEEAERSGMRITSGLVVSDRNLRPELHATPGDAFEASLSLIGEWHGRGRLRYAVTPRFAYSASEAMLEACAALLRSAPGVLLQSHLNENHDEISAVRALFPWARDYLDVYDRFALVGEGTVLAHNVHASERELARLAAARAWVAHCPTSNTFLGSGLFPMTAHLRHGVRLALGSDVGAGTGFSLLKEGLAAYGVQMLRDDGHLLQPRHLLYLATRAGALAMAAGEEAGDLEPGRAADLVLLRPQPGSVLEEALEAANSLEAVLGTYFTLAREESVAEVFLLGEPVLGRLGRTLVG
jgi:guanine deaminase